MTIEERYQAELKQSDLDHHKPTAGAMSSHILANLHVQRLKLKQGRFYSKGPETLFIQRYFAEWIEKEDQLFDELAELLLDEGEIIPTTLAEFTEYAMVTEDGRLKYEESPTILKAALEDFNNQNLFITRGIKLAEKEEKYPLQSFLIQLNGWINRQIRLLQSYLGIEAVIEDEEE